MHARAHTHTAYDKNTLHSVLYIHSHSSDGMAVEVSDAASGKRNRCVCAYVHACVRACMRACVRVCPIHIYICIYIYEYNI